MTLDQYLLALAEERADMNAAAQTPAETGNDHSTAAYSMPDQPALAAPINVTGQVDKTRDVRTTKPASVAPIFPAEACTSLDERSYP